MAPLDLEPLRAALRPFPSSTSLTSPSLAHPFVLSETLFGLRCCNIGSRMRSRSRSAPDTRPGVDALLQFPGIYLTRTAPSRGTLRVR